ncbi:uncharacterized protein [Panulirus ornatus]|uniref:uncharacterized protein isoform X1 n=1 Tax=Panulirus ornatus TaxID=150431 RepID=UPI003A8675C9
MARLLRPCIYYLWLGSLVSAASVISNPSSRVTHGATDACCSTSTSAISAETTDASTTIPSATSTRATGGTIAVNLPFTTDPSIRVEGKTPLTPTGPSDLNPKLQFVLPRTVIATWNDLGSQYHYCWMWMTLSEKLCKTTSEAQVRADRVPAGQEIQFWLNLSNNTMAWVVTLCYIPWQLRVGSSTSSFIMVEWASGEGVGEVCWDADGSRHTKALPQEADSRCEAVDFTDNYHVIKGLQPNTSYNVTLIQRHPLSFTVTTKDQDSYESLAWRCHENPCGTNRNCFPATSGLIQPRHVNDPVPDSYLYTCRSRKQAPLSCQGICHPSHEDVRVGSSTDLVVPEGHIVITHADFSTVSAQVANCLLPTALAVLKYWCDGKPVCHIEYGRLHSYLDGAHGCSRHTALQDFTLTLRFSTNLTNPGCSDGMQLYNNTCYGYGMLDETDFNTGRQSCLLLGGDIAYYINDKEFLDLWQGGVVDIGGAGGGSSTAGVYLCS